MARKSKTYYSNVVSNVFIKFGCDWVNTVGRVMLLTFDVPSGHMLRKFQSVIFWNTSDSLYPSMADICIIKFSWNWRETLGGITFSFPPIGPHVNEEQEVHGMTNGHFVQTCTCHQCCIQNSLLQSKQLESWVNFHTVPHHACINFRLFSTL